jgi:hypothetical protein
MGVVGQRHDPTAWPPGKRTGTQCIGGWVGPRAGLDGCENLSHTGIRSPDRPARKESLWRIRYPGPQYQTLRQTISKQWYKNWQRKAKSAWRKACLTSTLNITNYTWDYWGINPILAVWLPADRLGHDMAHDLLLATQTAWSSQYLWLE